MEYIRGGGSRRKRKGEGTTDAVVVASPSPCARGATARLPRPRKVSPVTFNFRAVGKSPPLELGHRPADSRPPPPSLPPPAILPYHGDGPSFSPPFLPPPPAKLSSLVSRSNFQTRAYTTFRTFFPSPHPSPSQSTKERKEKSREKDLERFLLHVSSRGGHEGVDARLPTSLSLVLATDHRNFKFRNGDENGRESGSIRRERRLFSLGGAVLSVYRSIDTDY